MKVRQLHHDEINNQQQRFPLCVLAEKIHSPSNVGLVFRTSEAMGVECIYVEAASFLAGKKKFEKAARSTEKRVGFEVVPDLPSCIQQLKAKGYTVFALEVTNTSQSIRKMDFKAFKAIALVIGAERNGIRQAVLDEVDYAIEIPMYGINTSMNIGTALAIGLYEITQQLQDQ